MEKRFAKLIREAMGESGVDRKALVNALGYRNQAKGFRRVDEWLAGDCPSREPMLSRLASALSLDVTDLVKARKEDYLDEAYEYVCQRAKDPCWYLFVIAFMGCAVKYRFPLTMTEDEVLAEGAKLANGSRYSIQSMMGNRTCVSESGRITRCRKIPKEVE